MNTKVLSAITALRGLAASIESSQKFGQLLPNGTTADWANTIHGYLNEIEEGLRAGNEKPPRIELGAKDKVVIIERNNRSSNELGDANYR